MNDYELALATALRAEAEEIAMSIDSHRATDEFESRMEHADRSRREVYWVAAAAAVVVIGVAALLGGNWSDESAPVMPGGPTRSNPPAAGTTYTSTSFVVPFTVTLPGWLSGPPGPGQNGQTSSRNVYWETRPCTSTSQDCWHRKRAVAFSSPFAIYRPGTAGPQPVPNYEDYLAFLDSLETTSGLSITERASTSVDGRPTTVMTLTASRTPDDARPLCDQSEGTAKFDKLDDCMFPEVGRPLRLAVVNNGTTPLVIWLTGATDDATDWPTLTQDFSTMLSSVRLGATPLPTAS